MNAETPVKSTGKSLLDVDDTVHSAVAGSRTSLPVRVLGKLSEIGDQPQLRLLSGGMIAAGLVRSDRRMIVAGTRMLLAHELATLAKDFVKHRVDRTRPRSADGREDEKPTSGHNDAKEESSFPSGHSAGAVAVASAFAAHYPAHATMARLVAGAVSLAQIPRCAHYPTDVGAGMAIGAAANAAVGLAMRLLARRALLPGSAPAN